MPYVVRKTNGNVLVTLQDGILDNSTAIYLVGRGFSGYGEYIADNFVRLMENFASNISPSNPLTGQLWYDTGNTTYKFYDSGWKELSRTGPVGFTGSIGYDGSRGSVGYAGSQGVAGYIGSRGLSGYTGSIGAQGYAGSFGGIGYTGSDGAGYTGSVGEIGYTGSQGPTNPMAQGISAVASPESSMGKFDDTQGMVAADEFYFYYCVADYDGVSNIWKRIPWDTSSW